MKLPSGSNSDMYSNRHLRPYRATRARLIAVNLLVVAGILALMAVAVYGWEIHATDQQVNDQLYERAAHALAESADGVFGLGASQSVGSSGSDSRDGNAEQYEPSGPDVFMVVVNRQGVVTFDPGNVRALGLPDAAAMLPVLAGQQASTLVTLGDDQHAYRLYSVPIRQHDQIVGALQVGMSLAARYRQLHDLMLILAVVGAAMLVITAAASFYLAGRALHPMRTAYERQRRFAAAASHELRTPLAIVRSEAELVGRALERLLRRPAPKDQAAPSLVASVTHAVADTAAASGEPLDHPERRTVSPEVGVRSNTETRDNERVERLVADMRDIVEEVDYMARLVDDLLLLARDEAAPNRIILRDVDLAAVATEAVAKLAPIARASCLTLRAQTTDSGSAELDDMPAALMVRGDRDRLKQLVLILVDNAIRYTPTGGSIEVTVGRVRERHLVPRHLSGHREAAILTVRDSGPGIARDDLPHVFEPFYRGKSVRAEGSGSSDTDSVVRPQGAGLGLAVARWIVLAHDGTIAVTSEPRHGATFTIALPLT